MVENMKNRHILKNVTQRSCVIAGIVALVAIVGMAGSYYYRNSKNGADTQQEQQASVGDEEQTGNVTSDAELEDYGTENGQDGAAEAMTQQIHRHLPRLLPVNPFREMWMRLPAGRMQEWTQIRLEM